MKEFKKIGCEVAAVSTDSKFCHSRYSKLERKEGGLGDLNIMLISDIDKVKLYLLNFRIFQQIMVVWLMILMMMNMVLHLEELI